jgi:hypothetical protein
MARVEHDLTAPQWAALTDAWGGCAYCGASDRALQKDCVLPISRGGRYTLENVVPACAACNASKCNDEVTAWMRRKRLDEKAFLVRQYEVRLALRSATSLDAGGHGTAVPSTGMESVSTTVEVVGSAAVAMSSPTACQPMKPCVGENRTTA